MGCLNVTFARKDNGIETTLTSLAPIDVQWGCPEKMCVQAQPVTSCDVDFSPVKTSFSVNVGLMCSVGQGVWEYLMCSDRGYIRTWDKGYILVRKR